MEIVLYPIIRNLREIYHLDGVMERYDAYVHLMTAAKGEVLPLGDFSPMGKRQREYLDELIDIGAEQLANNACSKASDEVVLSNDYRLILVVVDEPRNGWTHRFLTEADWRFAPLKQPRGHKKPWIVAHLWTTNDNLDYLKPTHNYIEQQIRSAVFRTYYRSTKGIPRTLQDMLNQEGAVMKFSEERFQFKQKELQKIAAVIGRLLNSDNYPVNFAAMYGDVAAEAVGYEPLGLPERAGFALAQSTI